MIYYSRKGTIPAGTVPFSKGRKRKERRGQSPLGLSPSTMTTYDVLDIHVSAVNPDTAWAFIRDMVKGSVPFTTREGDSPSGDSPLLGYVCVAPVSTIVDARRDLEYRRIVNAAAMVTPDGMPVAWLGRLKGLRDVRRTYGPDLMLRVCDEGRSHGFRHFFYGATDDICDRLEHNLKARFPGLVVAGTIAPPYMKEAAVLSAETVRKINAAKPDIIWVGLGSPKQDYWMALNRAALEVPVMVGIGAAFDFHAGVKPQAPRWMRVCALEWLFRLFCEPRRLWRRYLVGNVLFLYWLVKEAFVRK